MIEPVSPRRARPSRRRRRRASIASPPIATFATARLASIATSVESASLLVLERQGVLNGHTTLSDIQAVGASADALSYSLGGGHANLGGGLGEGGEEEGGDGDEYQLQPAASGGEDEALDPEDAA